MSSADDPRPVHVVIVAFNAPKALRACLRTAAGMPITVVDNSSNDDVRGVCLEAGADYLDAGANLGFGAAVNVALRSVLDAEPVDVLLLNPDAEINADEVRCLQARFLEPGGESVGALAPVLVNPEGKPQRVLWPFPHPARAWVEALGLGRLNRQNGFAVGAVLLLRWEALREVGLFDERFFLYAEETDWQRRAAALGWQSAVEGSVQAVHVGGGTSSDPRRRETLFHAGGETYQRKWFGAVGWSLYRAAVIAGCLPRMALPTGAGRRAAARRLSLHLRGPRRVAGLEGAR